MKINETLKQITTKHEELLLLRPKFTKELEKNLYDWFRIALTYSSNAIEGNTLSQVETAQVIEKDITIPGKSLTEHLEAINHAEAIDCAKQLANLKTRKDLTVSDILTMHHLILQKINNDYAGKLRDVPVRIMGSTMPLPNFQKVPILMDDLVNWLHVTKDHVAKIAADVHLKLAFIHPFIDGNGRTARLLMNLILLQEKYPLIFISAEDRLMYIKAIQKALHYATVHFTQEEFVSHSHSLEIDDFQDYYCIIFEAINFSLDEYLKTAREL